MEYHNLTKIISLQKYNMPTMEQPTPVSITTLLPYQQWTAGMPGVVREQISKSDSKFGLSRLKNWEQSGQLVAFDSILRFSLDDTCSDSTTAPEVQSEHSDYCQRCALFRGLSMIEICVFMMSNVTKMPNMI